MNSFLETGISLVLLFFIFSIITYIIQELIAVNLRYRSKMLWKSIEQILEGKSVAEGRVQLMKALPEADKPFTREFYAHAQIRTLQKDLKKKPSYIPASSFALAIIDLVAQRAGNKTADLFTDFRNGLRHYINSGGQFGQVLGNLLDHAVSLQDLKGKIEDWYNQYMQRVTGWYESHTVASVRIIALALALVFNLNVIELAKTIYRNGELRGKMTGLAEKIAGGTEGAAPQYYNVFEKKAAVLQAEYEKKIHETADAAEKEKWKKELSDTLDTLAATYTRQQKIITDTLLRQLRDTGLPLGWKERPAVFSASFWKKQGPGSRWWQNLLLALIGWTIAAGCISMGAPFWFDMLGKLVNVRRSGIKPEKK